MHSYCATLSTVARWSRRSWLGVLCLLSLSCLSPTLPLPPPAAPEVTGPNEQGLVTLSGTVNQPRAFVHAYNHRTDHADGEHADGEGKYQFQMAARAGDAVDLWYEYANDESSAVRFVIPKAEVDAGPPATFAPPSVTGPAADGSVVLVGSVPVPGADVMVRNQRTGRIAGIPADSVGAYRIELADCLEGDSLEVWYQAGGVPSQRLTITLAPG
jgi:hypothetical protein